jgi:triphosphoribosyl-dephospho-CoA synthase
VVQGSLGRADFDDWLREGGHGRNPGTTADLVTAGLFVGLREGWLSPRHPF